MQKYLLRFQVSKEKNYPYAKAVLLIQNNRNQINHYRMGQ